MIEGAITIEELFRKGGRAVERDIDKSLGVIQQLFSLESMDRLRRMLKGELVVPAVPQRLLDAGDPYMTAIRNAFGLAGVVLLGKQEVPKCFPEVAAAMKIKSFCFVNACLEGGMIMEFEIEKYGSLEELRYAEESLETLLSPVALLECSPS